MRRLQSELGGLGGGLPSHRTDQARAWGLSPKTGETTGMIRCQRRLTLIVVGNRHRGGSALTYRGVQLNRPTVYALEEKLHALSKPVLIMIGDEDGPCVEPAIFMKRTIPNAGLAVFPQSGHTINLEEPDLFNRAVSDFVAAVEAGKWAKGAG